MWHGKIIPSHFFILSLAIRRKLYSQDRLVAIALLQEMKHVLCGLGEENIDIFLFAAHCQKVFGIIFGTNVMFFGLEGTRRGLFGVWPPASEANIFLSIVLRIMTVVTVYTLSCKRNFRLFQRRNRDFGCIVSELI